MLEGNTLKHGQQAMDKTCGNHPAREMGVRDMLKQRADGLRAEALRLEMLAAQYPDGMMQPDAESTLARLVAGGLYR